MRDTDREEKRNPDRGIGAGKSALKDQQRDVQDDAPHMPRHWQASGARGEAPGQGAPEPDPRELGNANQYGEAGKAAGEQLHRELDEHGRSASPQRRDNEQLPKRAGEGADDLPTPGDKKAARTPRPRD